MRRGKKYKTKSPHNTLLSLVAINFQDCLITIRNYTFEYADSKKKKRLKKKINYYELFVR